MSEIEMYDEKIEEIGGMSRQKKENTYGGVLHTAKTMV